MRQLIFLLTGLAVAANANAQQDAKNSNQSFTGINTVIISDFTGRLEISVEGAKVDASLAGGEVPFPFSMAQSGNVLTLAGTERPRNYDVNDEIKWRRDHDEAFRNFIDDYPILRVSIPAGTNLTLDSAIAIANIGDINGTLTVHKSYVEGNIGDVADADVYFYGPGDVTLGVVNNHLKAKLSGSGSFAATSAGSADLSIGGSGDIEIGAIAGDTDLKIGGSGDMAIADIDGALNARVSGSGDIETGDVGKGGAFKVSGSGDIFSRSVNGPVTATISGSGDISIGDGRAEDLEVSIRGSGDFEFDGVSTNLDASVHGSGSVDVAENIGALKTSGRGEFRVGGVTIEND